ncbi:hypothetical protein IJG72_02825 [bacterium]|nr:hypothetical protein [bacterium]
MKKLLATLALFAVIAMPACAAETIGYIYQNGTTPGGGYTATQANKVGSTTCKSYFHLVGLGDCAVLTAMKNGNIKSLAGFDVYKKNILGFQKITIKAWGN